jgi:predicted RNase H-like HicB family nuclease
MGRTFRIFRAVLRLANRGEEVLSLIREAIALHLEGLKEQGQPIPAPASTSDHVEVEAA